MRTRNGSIRVVLASRVLRLGMLIALGCACLSITTVSSDSEVTSRSLSRAESNGFRRAIIRETPVRITAIGDMRDEIPHGALVDVLRFSEPYWEYRRASDILHALRLWGPDASFPERPAFGTPLGIRAMSGIEMLQFFTDHRSYRERYPNARSYFFRSPFGLGARQGSNTPALTSHWDDFAALAAEIGLQANHPIHWSLTEGGANVEDVLHHSFAWFHRNNESEFSTIAYAQYLHPPATWSNRFGQEFSLDTLVDCLVDRDLESAACYGTHVPYSLAVLIRVDAMSPVLSHGARQKAASTLRNLSDELVRSQHAGGFWSRHWCRQLAQTAAIEDEQVEWVRVTGHHLEWMALVAPDLRPGEEVIKRAIRFILRSLRNRNVGPLTQGIDYGPVSHAARALVLWSGHYFATEVMQQDWHRRKFEDLPKD